MTILHVPHYSSTPAECTPIVMSGTAFLDWIADPRKVPSLECPAAADKKNGPCWMFCQFTDDAASKNADNIHPESSTDVLCYDIDHTTRQAFLALMIKIKGTGLRCVSLPTWRYTRANPRVRLLFALNEPVRHADGHFAHAYMALAHLMGIPYDTSTTNPNRLFYTPQHKPGGHTGRISL